MSEKWKQVIIDCLKIVLAAIFAGGSFAGVSSQMSPPPVAPEVKVLVMLPDHSVVPAVVK